MADSIAEIQSEAKTFAAAWNSQVDDCPILILDGTWPSVGTLDLMTHHLRRVEKFDREAITLIRGVAAYLCALALECWAKNAASLSVVRDENGTTLIATGGPYLGVDESFRITLEPAIARVLQVQENPFPVWSTFERHLSPTHNYFSLFALGVCTGLSPFGEGPWRDLAPEDFKENLDRSVKRLGASCVRYYERVFPGETLGQVGELYLKNLIIPPSCMTEALPGGDGVRGVRAFATEFQIGNEPLSSLAFNLAQSPDELQSGVGVVIAAALLTKGISGRLRGATEAKGPYMGLLRQALVTARELFLGEAGKRDWLTAPDFLTTDLRLFEYEKALGFIPWVFMNSSILSEKKKEPRLPELFSRLSYFDLEGSRLLADEILADIPGERELRLQRIYLELLARDFDRCDSMIRALLTEPEADEDSRLFTLWGLKELAMGNYDQGVVRLKTAYSLTSTEHPRRAEVANDYGWALILAQSYEGAIAILDEALIKSKFSLTSRLNRAYALRLLGRKAEADDEINFCVRFAPLDRRVFANAFSFTG